MRADAVVAGRTAADLHPEPAGGQIDLVVEHHHLGRRQLEEGHGVAHRAAALVVEGLRLQGQHLLAGDRPLADEAGELRPLAIEAPFAGDGVHGHEAEIVPIAGIRAARIAEPREDQHERICPLNPTVIAGRQSRRPMHAEGRVAMLAWPRCGRTVAP